MSAGRSSSLDQQDEIPDSSWRPDFAVIETTMGPFMVEMYWKKTPNACRNFMELVRRGYYNNTKFHKVIQNCMIQGGDPTGTGRGGRSIYGLHFDDEIHRNLKHNDAGILSMANIGPNTNGSQFIITLGPTPWMDGKNTVFGRVQEGMKIVERLSSVDCDVNDSPLSEIKIIKAWVSKTM